MWAALFGSLFGLLFSGVWIGAALGITGIIIIHFSGPGIGLLGSTTWESINMYALTSLPGFIFMGEVIEESGISGRIYNAVAPLMARIPGKLLQSNILVSAMFAAVVGSSSANAAIVGGVAIPELRRRKYNDRMILGSVCVAGTLGLLIPPSGALVIYGVMSNTSIAALFAAGTVPGILLALAFMGYIAIKGTITPNIAPAEEKPLPWKPTLRSLLKVWPLVFLMVVCIVPIYIGWCTPVEGAGVGALAAIVIGVIFGNYRWQTLKISLVKTTQTSSMILFLIVGAMILSIAVSVIGAPRALAVWIGSLPLSPTIILLLIFLMYIIMGCFLDGISMLLVTLPFIVPTVTALGVDPIWFGVELVLVIEIGLVTPPVALNLFVVQGIAGPKTSLTDIFMGSIPFLWVTLGMLFFLLAFPGLVTFFPKALGL